MSVDVLIKIYVDDNGNMVIKDGGTYLPYAQNYYMPDISSDHGKFSNYSLYLPSLNRRLYKFGTKGDLRYLLKPNQPWTFSIWAMPSADSARYASFISGYYANGYQRLSMLSDDNSTCQPVYCHRDTDSLNKINRGKNPVTKAQMCDGNWHHFVWTHDTNSTIYTFFDGILLNTEIENEDIDFGYTDKLMLFTAVDDAFTYVLGYFDDITFLKGICMWTSDFTPPTKRISTLTATTKMISNNVKID